MGAIGSIPRSKIKAYILQELDLTIGDEFDRVYAILRRADNAYVSMVNSGSGSAKDDLADVVKATDVSGVKNMMRRLGNRYKGGSRNK